MGQLLFENVELEGINLDKTPYNYYFRNNKNKIWERIQIFFREEFQVSTGIALLFSPRAARV